MILLIVYIISFIIGACVGFLIYYNCKPALCDSCKYLEQKNGGEWKFRCDRMEMHFNGRNFDKAPTYCKYYERRDDNCSTQK